MQPQGSLPDLLARVQAKSKFHAQPGAVVEARLEQRGISHFLSLAFAFESPLVAQGYVVTAALEGDYLNVTSYTAQPDLGVALARAERLAGAGFCSECESPWYPQETLVGREVTLTCRSCGHTDTIRL